MTLKQQIYQILSATGLPTAYRFSDTSQLPRFSYSLVYNGELRLSGRTHSKKPSYQIDYFTQDSVDIESFELFEDVRNALRERNISVGNWQELENYNENEEFMLFHYYLECEK